MPWGKNIFDTNYWTTVIPLNDSQGRFAGMPATYGITIGFKVKQAKVFWAGSELPRHFQPGRR